MMYMLGAVSYNENVSHGKHQEKRKPREHGKQQYGEVLANKRVLAEQLHLQERVWLWQTEQKIEVT